MSLVPPLSPDFHDYVERLLKIAQLDPVPSTVNISAIQTSLRKALAPRFEIIFAGAFSAGKSMLINALLGRELLYSAEGHATGTECQVAYADADQERVVLTFLSQADVVEQIQAMCGQLGITVPSLSDMGKALEELRSHCQQIIQTEGGANKSERGKQASGLQFLITGFLANRERIHPTDHQIFSMDQLNLTNLKDAAAYARRSANSAVLKKIEYYCHHPLLKDGNILIDTPGIDAPVKKDAAFTYQKIQDPDASAVVCVLKPAAIGDLSIEETELLDITQHNRGIRDRLFYVFNRIDETWYNHQLQKRLDTLLSTQFHHSERVFKTSALLGFYGVQLRSTSLADRFGLDSFLPTVGHASDDVPQFINEFIRYCASAGKLPADQFRIDIRSYESPIENYERILSEQGQTLIEHLILDSGIEQFRHAITRYLTEEKRPQLLATLVSDLEPLCTHLRQQYEEQWHTLHSQPQDVASFKDHELSQLGNQLQTISTALQADWEAAVNEVVASESNSAFEEDFTRLKARMVSRLDELLSTFSVGEVHRRAQMAHRRNSVVPLLGILSEAFYYLANGLEDVLVDCVQDINETFFRRLGQRATGQDYYRQLRRLVGNDAGILGTLEKTADMVTIALTSEARIECDRYVRERPGFFDEKTASIWQMRQTLQQACYGYDYHNMVEAEPAIRQLLKMDFEEKVRETVFRTFRQTINQTLNHHVLQATKTQGQLIMQQYDAARDYLVVALEKEAQEKIRQHQRQVEQLRAKIVDYNEAVVEVNGQAERAGLEQKLPLIEVLGLNGQPKLDQNHSDNLLLTV